MKLHILTVRPEGYVHALGLAEFAETVYYGLLHLGHEATLGSEHQSCHNIVIGGHLAENLPSNCIIYNSEQVGGPWFTEKYIALLKTHEVWDYSSQNVERLRALGIEARHVPIGYVKELERIKPAEVQDIDVLFYGSLNERRAKILEELKAKDLNVVHLFGVYGEERDSYIARAKVVLNMHFYDPGVFEIVRCSYLFTNGKAVVSEQSLDSVGVSYSMLVNECQKLVQYSEKRAGAESWNYYNMRRAPEKNFLEEALTQKINRLEYQQFQNRYLHACTAGLILRKPKHRRPFTVVVTSNNEGVYNANLRASPAFVDVPILKVVGASSAADAFGQGKAQAKTDWILFCHHDTWWPQGCRGEIETILDEESEWVDVIGFAGLIDDKHAGFAIDRGWRFDYPVEGTPNSIEEFAMLLRREVTLDASLGWHTYGTDLCQRYSCKLVRVPVFHNSQHDHSLPPDYHESSRILAAKYPQLRLRTLNGEIHA
ncbi:MAG TPA: hypothetical protein VMS08_06325 [Candidatus Saccharimonadia bacterium]|nr:hypothetical protein [Candidatus Saccharimonadia bacterium]